MHKETFIEWLRIIASFLVVLLHTAILPRGTDTIQLVYKNIGYLGVPLFVIISGYLLLKDDRECTYRDSLKYSIRYLIPLIVWGFGYACLEAIFNGERNIINISVYAIQALISGTTWSHMWYLYMIVGIVVMLPMFKILVQHCSKRTLQFIIIAIVIVYCVFPVFESLFSLQIIRYLSVSNIYIAYFLCGGYISRYAEGTISYKKIIMILAVICLVIPLFTVLKGIDDIGLNGYSSLPVFCSSVSVFLLIRCMRSNIKYDTIAKFSKLTLGVYLVHPIILNVLVKVLRINYISSDILVSIVSILIICCFVYAISMIATSFMKKIPCINRIV